MPISNLNDLSQGFSNLAAAFGPPSGSDIAGYASAKDSGAAAALKKQHFDQIAQLFADANSPDWNRDVFDRQGAVAGAFNPTNGFGARDMADATARRGQDITASTSIANNQNTVQGSTIGSLFGPLNQGQIRPDIPANVAATVGLPQMPQVLGAPKPLSETEVKGGLLQQQLPANPPQLTNDQTVALTMGTTPVENIVGGDGKPEIVLRPQAVGREPAAPAGADQRQPPAGYRWAADGNLEFIPHGPADPATAGKTTMATRRNQQLAEVIAPELASLLGDGTVQNPGTFDSLANGTDILKGATPGAQALGVGPSGDYQQAQNSLRTIIASYLYSVSGATANPGEVDTLMSTLTPKLNEDPKSVAAKKARLQQMVQAVQNAASGAPFSADGTAPDTSPVAPPQAGDIVDGYTFNGGDPADPASWSQGSAP